MVAPPVASGSAAVASSNAAASGAQSTGPGRKPVAPHGSFAENFWAVTPKNRAQCDSFFTDLAGNKPFSSLFKKVCLLFFSSMWT